MTFAELTEKANTLTPSSDWERDLYDFVRRWNGPDDFIQVRTSGSTGTPKLVSHRKEAMRQSARMTCDFLNLKPGMSALLCLSTRNIAGMMMVVRAFERDLDLLSVPPGSHPLEGVHGAPAIDFCAMVPAQVQNSLDHEEQRLKLFNIKNIIIGGAPVSFTLQQRISRMPGHVWATFGMTETMSHIAMRRLNGPGTSLHYNVLEGVQVRTLSDGRLVLHVPFLGGEPIETNDLAEITGPGAFRWLGRADHVINSGGNKIYPETVESVIAPVVSAIFGQGNSTQRFFIAPKVHERLGHVPVLVVEYPPPAETLREEHMQQLQHQLAPLLPRHEIPREVWYAPRFIETPTGKIIRSATLKRIFIS